MTWSWRWSILPAMRISYISTSARWVSSSSSSWSSSPSSRISLPSSLNQQKHHQAHHWWAGRQMVGGSDHCCSLLTWTSRWQSASSSLTWALLLGYPITQWCNWSNNKNTPETSQTLCVLIFATKIATLTLIGCQRYNSLNIIEPTRKIAT